VFRAARRRYQLPDGGIDQHSAVQRARRVCSRLAGVHHDRRGADRPIWRPVTAAFAAILYTWVVLFTVACSLDAGIVPAALPDETFPSNIKSKAVSLT